MDYGLIALDLDYTLLQKDHTISARAAAAVKQCYREGIHVTLATGRMFRSALPYARELGLDIPLITYQGSLVKYADGREISHLTIEKEMAAEIMGKLKEKDVHVNLYLDDELLMEEFNAYGEKYVNITKVPYRIVDFSKGLTGDPTAFMVIAEPDILMETKEMLEDLYGDSLSCVTAKRNFLQISHPAANKGNALKAVAESLGVGMERTAAVGDEMNDMEMIRMAGLGAAIGNAVEPLKEIADIIAPPHYEDGAAYVIEKYILRKNREES